MLIVLILRDCPASAAGNIHHHAGGLEMRKTTLVSAALVAIVAAAATFALSTTGFAASATSRTDALAITPTLRALDDPTIVAIFDAANTADIETGELAVKKGSTKEVRDFGAMLVRDHKTVRQQGRDLAKKLGVTPTPPKDDAGAKAHAAAMKELRGVSGSAFDHAFLQHEVAFHKGVIDAVTTTLLPAIKNAELKDLVTKVAPAFQAHMLAAENLEKQLAAK
jgi:putative membrane protein